jgi:hypothetical protein
MVIKSASQLTNKNVMLMTNKKSDWGGWLLTDSVV